MASDLYKLYQFIRYHYNALRRHDREWEAEVSKLHVLGKLTGDIADKCISSGLFDSNNNKPVIPEMLSIIRKEVDILTLQEIAKETSNINIKKESSSGDSVNLQNEAQYESTLKPYVNNHDLRSPIIKQCGHNKPQCLNLKPVKNQFPQGMLSRRKPMCFFCHSNQHESHFCNHYSDPADFRKFLLQYGHCFNCLEHGHRSWECVKFKICANRCGDSRKHSPVLCHSVY